MIGGIPLRAGGTIDANDLRDRSELPEAGAKFSFLDHQLYGDAYIANALIMQELPGRVSG